MSKPSLEQLTLVFGSEFPTERAPERAALIARMAVATQTDAAEVVEPTEFPQARVRHEKETFCDSEAPTSVAAERPLLPRPPRSPKL